MKIFVHKRISIRAKSNMQSRIDKKKKSQLKMGEKEASVTESNNEEYVHSTSSRNLNNTHREKL